MKRTATIGMLLASLAVSIWIMADSSMGSLHKAFTHYDQKSIIIQAGFAAVCIFTSFAIGNVVGGMFRKRK